MSNIVQEVKARIMAGEDPIEVIEGLREVLKLKDRQKVGKAMITLPNDCVKAHDVLSKDKFIRNNLVRPHFVYLFPDFDYVYKGQTFELTVVVQRHKT